MSFDSLDLPATLATDVASLPGLIERLTWSFLDGAGPFADGEPSLQAADRLSWHRLGGSERREGDGPRSVPIPWLLALTQQPDPVGFRIQQDAGEVSVLVGVPAPIVAQTLRSLRAMIGGPAVAASHPRRDPRHVARGCLSGVPCRVAWADPSAEASEAFRGWLDPALDSLRHESFSLTVWSSLEPADNVVRRRHTLREAAKSIDRQHLKVEQLANADRTARRASELIEAHLRRLDEGLTEGLWRTSVVATAPSRAVVRHLLALIAGASAEASERSTVPVRVHDCAPEGSWPVHANVLKTTELARLWGLPTRDRHGFALTPSVRFDVGIGPTAPGVRLGDVLDGDDPSGQPFVVEPRILCRHALIAGHTGSGKSTTIRRLLQGALDVGVPFLVLDPVKPVEREYHDLLAAHEKVLSFRAGAAPGRGEALFQFNPMAFPVGFSLFTHIDYLKAAFTAAFGLSPPGPYLLESAILRTYRRFGWDVGTGTHRRGASGRDPLVYPRLSDLLVEVERVVEAANYGDEVSRNLKAALRTRIGNLCLGTKGASLDTYEQLPDAVLYDAPVVLGLSAFGAHEEQALLMGMVMTRLFEYRVVQGMPAGEKLCHLLVIEEAHRLLKATAQRSSEEGNMAHQAVQMFSSMIAEIRAYGQGFVIAEQLPSLLSAEVVKQTGLKVVHRLTPRDDRDLVGDAMTLSDPQKDALSVLSTGEAVAFMEGMDGAVRVRIDRLPAVRQRGGVTSLARLRRATDPSETARFDRALERAKFAGPLSLDATIHAADLVLTMASWGEKADKQLAALGRLLETLMEGDLPGVSAAETFALEDALLRRAVIYGWSYEAWRRACHEMRADRGAFLGRLAGTLRQNPGPHEWCAACPSPCRYRPDGEGMAAEGEFLAEFHHARRAPSANLGAALALAVRRGALRRFGSGPARVMGTGYCAIGHASMQRGDRIFETMRLLTEFTAVRRKP